MMTNHKMSQMKRKMLMLVVVQMSLMQEKNIKNQQTRIRTGMRLVLTDGDTETFLNANQNSMLLKNRASMKSLQSSTSNSFRLTNLQILWLSKQTCIAPNNQEILLIQTKMKLSNL